MNCQLVTNGVICDFDEENFEVFCLPVKRTSVMLLLHALVAVIAIPCHVAHMYLVMTFFSFTLSTAVHGYHVYQDNWEPEIGDYLYSTEYFVCTLT